MSYRLEVPATDLEAVVLCLALGSLEAMRGANWPLEAGIWTLGRSTFREPLVDAGVDQAVLTVLQSVDELSALEELRGRATAEAELDRMIAIVRQRLSALGERTWYARWVSQAE